MVGWIVRRRPGAVSAAYEEVERAEQAFYINYLREGMTVFDVGANVGELSLLFSRFIGSGTVHAFEASARVYASLTAVLSATGRRNVIANNVAMSDRSGTVRLHCYEGAYQSWNSLARRPLEQYGIDVQSTHHEDVPASTVDEYCRTHGIAQIDLLKVDVEGAELQVLQGAAGMLASRRVGCVTFEFGQTTFDMGNTPRQLQELLHAHGYAIRNVVKGDPLFPGGQHVRTARFAMHVATPR